MSTTTMNDYRLPTADDGVDGLLRFAETFGDEQVLAFLNVSNWPSSPIGQARAMIAARLVREEMLRDPSLTYTLARRRVGKAQGYLGTRLYNFQRLADPGRELLRQRGQWPFDAARDR